LSSGSNYHVHLAHLDNVVAIAIGLYRVRRTTRGGGSP
jgi:hypothetical protein